MKISKEDQLYKEELEQQWRKYQEESKRREREQWASFGGITLKEGLLKPEKINSIAISGLHLKVRRYHLWLAGRHEFYVSGPNGGKGSISVMDWPEEKIESVLFKYDSWNSSQKCGNLEEVYCWL